MTLIKQKKHKRRDGRKEREGVAREKGGKEERKRQGGMREERKEGRESTWVGMVQMSDDTDPSRKNIIRGNIIGKQKK
jgi:hypothetical protein